MVVPRDRRLNILISEEEQGMLQALADADGVTASDFVRTFIRKAHAERFPPKKTKR
jgi:hypothetical protein